MRQRGLPRRGAPTWAVKVIMAVTGLLWAAFALVHLYGNLKVYSGPESFNAYAAWLREAFYPLFPHTGVLWSLRVVLVVSLVLHVWGALVLWRRNRLARGPVRARRTGWVGWTAWLMLPTGFLILAFLVAHVLDLTIGAAPVAPEAFEPAPPGGSHAYANLVASLSRPGMGIGYAAAMVVLAAHLLHGLVLAAHDLGTTGRRTLTAARVLAWAVAAVIVLGNALIPVLVLAGAVS